MANSPHHIFIKRRSHVWWSALVLIHMKINLCLISMQLGNDSYYQAKSRNSQSFCFRLSLELCYFIHEKVSHNMYLVFILLFFAIWTFISHFIHINISQTVLRMQRFFHWLFTRWVLSRRQTKGAYR